MRPAPIAAGFRTMTQLTTSSPPPSILRGPPTATWSFRPSRGSDSRCSRSPTRRGDRGDLLHRRADGSPRDRDGRGNRRPWPAPARWNGSGTGGSTVSTSRRARSPPSPVFGTSAGAFVALSDILGNDQYYFLVYNNAESQDEILSSFNVAISRISLSKRTGYAYGIYRFAGRQYDLTSEDVYYYEKVFGGYLSLSYPLSKFERLETSVSLSNSLRDNYSLVQRRALLLSNSVSFVHDNSLWGPTGPLDGRRFSLTLAYTSDIQYSNVNYFSIIADYRQYLRISLRSAFASRLWLFYNDGKESRRFVMGGSWDLRGWPRWSIRGEKLWLVSNELRFPLLDELGLRFPFGGHLLRRVPRSVVRRCRWRLGRVPARDLRERRWRTTPESLRGHRPPVRRRQNDRSGSHEVPAGAFLSILFRLGFLTANGSADPYPHGAAGIAYSAFPGKRTPDRGGRTPACRRGMRRASSPLQAPGTAGRLADVRTRLRQERHRPRNAFAPTLHRLDRRILRGRGSRFPGGGRQHRFRRHAQR